MATTTNHSGSIFALRERGTTEDDLAADLLELHDRTSLSLDNWASAREFIEARIGQPIQENGA